MILAVDIRPAQATDIPAIAQVHLDSAKIAYQDILDRDLLDSLSLAGRIDLWESRYASIGPRGRLWVQSVDSAIVGFALCDESDDRDAEPMACELKSFYLVPDFWGAGLGARLIAHAANEFHDRGFGAMILWTIRRNTRARGFYERQGFCCNGVTRRTKRAEAGQILEYEEIRYARSL